MLETNANGLEAKGCLYVQIESLIILQKCLLYKQTLHLKSNSDKYKFKNGKWENISMDYKTWNAEEKNILIIH